jgi:choline dehydrogenase-like flavoprotein
LLKLAEWGADLTRWSMANCASTALMAFAVVDASVMPEATNANTNALRIMIAKKGG